MVTEKDFRNVIQRKWNKHPRSEDATNEYAIDLRTSIIRVGHASYHEKFRCAKLIEFDDMLKFCRQFFKQMKITAHIQGNLTVDQAKAIIQTVETNLGCEKIEEVR